jgi:predicted phosphodiesterase
MLALMYDIHGNLPAFEAARDDARQAGADRFLLGGDYALFGPYPAETVSALRELPDCLWIRGNVDRWSAHPDDAPDDELIRSAIAACRDALGPEVVRELGSLPEQTVLDGTLYCHASPVSDVRSFLPDPAEDEDELLDGVSERRVVFGHTHLAFARVRPDGVELVNPGSVGLPFVEWPVSDAHVLPWAEFGIVEFHADGELDVELRRTPYDARALVEHVLESGVPHAKWWTDCFVDARPARRAAPAGSAAPAASAAPGSP